jgi:hypothetical protein
VEVFGACPIIFFIIIVVVAIAFGQARARNTGEAYSQLARHYGGTCDSGGLFSRPRVQFPHAGAWVVVDIYSTGGKHATYYTQVHFTGQQPNVRCEVYPERMWSRMGKLMGMEDVEIGSPGFDDQYIIKGNTPSALRGLLTPPVQQQIERLRHFLGNGDIYVSFNRSELLVKKLSHIRDFRALLQYTQLAIGLYDLSVETGQEGIEFVKAAAPPKLTEAVCQICGEKIEHDVVFCRRCRTPHHQDCWQYYGACSTYGCRETRYLRPKSRRAKRAQQASRPPRKSDPASAG